MSFLASWALWALPAIGLPILIHLIYKRRQRVVEWGAMRFLLQGAKLSRGMQRLRHLLLLTLRTLAVLGLVLGLGRPLAGGWLGGLGGGQPDSVLVLLDRSASMGAEVSPRGPTKLAAGVERLAQALESVGATRFACIDSVSLGVTELGSPADLTELAIATETSAEADIPAMLEIAVEHLETNNVGRAEIWILSDAQVSDWNPEDGRWPLLDEALSAVPAGVRVNVLSLSEVAPENFAVRVERADRVTGEDKTELVLDLRVHASSTVEKTVSLPVALHVGGARSVVSLELSGDEAVLRGHRVEVAVAEGEAWGFVELPGDSNSADNRYYFTFGTGAVAETLVVWEDESVRDVLRFAAEAPTSEGTQFVARTLFVGDTGSFDLGGVALLLWQGPLPTGETAARVESFVEGGGRVIFLPPEEPTGDKFLGCGWGTVTDLVDPQGEPGSPSFWRTQADLLRHGADGTPLTVGELRVRLLHPVLGDVTRLAGFAGGETLLARVPTAQGGVYMLATSTAAVASNMATQGVALVAVVTRALEAALDGIGSRGQEDAGRFAPIGGRAEFVSESSPDWLLREHLFHAGVVRAGERLVALNRSRAEDFSKAMEPGSLQALLPDVDVSWVAAGVEEGGLVEEIWRVFLILLLLALLGEALLSISESSPKPAGRP